MKKTKARFDPKDRVVCVTIQGRHEFYYQPVGSRKRILLFVTNDFSGSIFDYFRNKGRNMNDRGFSLTIKELYEFKEYHNYKLTLVMKRIPSLVDYVVRECSYSEHDDDGRAA